LFYGKRSPMVMGMLGGGAVAVDSALNQANGSENHVCYGDLYVGSLANFFRERHNREARNI
jgi:hypothetical protein